MTEREKAEQYVTEGRRIVAEQQAKVDRLRATGRETYDAEQELRVFEELIGDLRGPPALASEGATLNCDAGEGSDDGRDARVAANIARLPELLGRDDQH